MSFPGNFPNISPSDRRLCGLPIIGFPSALTPVLQFNAALSAFEWVAVAQVPSFSFIAFSTGGFANLFRTAGINFPSLIINHDIVAEATAQVLMDACTLSRPVIFVDANAATNANTLRTRINGVNGNIAITVGAGATGRFEDNVNSDVVPNGALVNSSTTQAVTGNVSFRGGWMRKI